MTSLFGRSRRAPREPCWLPTIGRAGRYRKPEMHEDMVTIKGITTAGRQIAVRNIGRDEPMLMITNALAASAKDLVHPLRRTHDHRKRARRLHRRVSPQRPHQRVPLNVDLDTTLTVVAGNLYRILARDLSRYETATPERIRRHFLDNPGTLDVTDDAITFDLKLRTYHPNPHRRRLRRPLDLPIPWWNNRSDYASASHPAD